MRPEAWGKALWQTMHAVALEYPRNPTELQKLAYRTFFVGLGDVIPCKSCAASYRRLLYKRGALASLDSALEGGSKTCANATSPLFDWTVDIHNAVNAELGKAPWTAQRTLAAVLRGGTEDALPPPPISTSNDVIVASWKAMAVGFLFAIVFVAMCVAFYQVVRSWLKDKLLS